MNDTIFDSQIKQEWFENINRIEISKNFLQSSFIKGLMFSNDQDIFINEITWIEKNYPEKLILLKNPILFGNPDIKIYKENTFVANDIHMAYHILKYDTYNKLNNTLNIFEWGGGYGNFYKVLKIIFPEKIKSYTIVDLPECIELQKYYLKNINFIDNNIFFYSSLDINNINIKPCDLFISTWAISESPTNCFNFLKEKQFYNCNRFLISLHQCGDHIPFMQESTYIFNYFKSLDYYNEFIPFISGTNYYIFK
jgi:hypothetical protein